MQRRGLLKRLVVLCEHIIKQHAKMRQQMAMVQRMGGMEAVMEKMRQHQSSGVPGKNGQ